MGNKESPLADEGAVIIGGEELLFDEPSPDKDTTLIHHLELGLSPIKDEVETSMARTQKVFSSSKPGVPKQ